MNEYKGFSYYFDQIMEYIDYNEWLNFTMENIKPGARILDLACGSGLLAALLNIEGYETDGLDLSAEMLSIANDRFKGNHINTSLYQMDMSSFTLPKSYDVVTCYFDSVNHLPTLNMVKGMMRSVYDVLNEDGLFLFDIFSYSKYKDMDNTNIEEEFEDFSYKWKINLEKPNILTHDIEIFGDENIHEIYNEYYYSLDDIIDKELFEVVKIVGDFNDDLADEDERILVVLKKKPC